MARDREEGFRQLADNIDEVFFIIDAHNKEMLYINSAYEKIWGRSRESLYDDPQSFLEPIPDDDRRRLLEHMDRVQRGEQPGKIEFRVVHANGSIKWLLSQAVPVRNEKGEVYRISGLSLDITEFREAQLALQESAERYLKLSDASFDAISISQDGIPVSY